MTSNTESKVYRFIESYIAKHDIAPTNAEVAAGIGICSRGVVHRHVSALVKKGRLKREPGKRRNIRLVPAWQKLKVLGEISSGQRLSTGLQAVPFDLVNFFTLSNGVVFSVCGDDWASQGILSGDYLICERSAVAHDHDPVLALIDNERVELARFCRRAPDMVELIPLFKPTQEMIYKEKDVYIQCIIKGLLRKT